MVFAIIICFYPTVLYVKVKNKVKLLTPKPNDTVGRMVIDDNLDILKFIVFFEDNVVSFDTIIHVLFGKTTALKYLEVMSQICELDIQVDSTFM